MSTLVHATAPAALPSVPANRKPAPRHAPQAPARTPIAVAHGDGIGPEVMDATLAVLDALDAGLEYRFIDIGRKVYDKGITAGIEPTSWDVLRDTRVFLKAPITTPQGGGYKSLNVTTRKTLGLYANVRPCVAYHPFVPTRHPLMDVVIIRENEEDTYAGIEHRQTDEVVQCLKLITRPGCEKIVRYAFEYARNHGRKKVSCFTKDNIMKLTDGLFHKVFDEIAEEYPDIETDHWIIDIGAARLADSPERFDVIVTLNLYGDIISDIAAQVAGSVGLGGSANIGSQCAMFEAIHGSAPDIAGKDIANPSGLLLSAVQMLVHLGKHDQATTLHNAWLATIEQGIHTPDIYSEQTSKRKVGTRAFAQAVIANLGKQPQTLQPVHYTPTTHEASTHADAERSETSGPKPQKQLVGVDVFLDWDAPGRDADELALELHRAAAHTGLKLKMITNRGVKVWPAGMPETFCTDHWRCRFVLNPATQPSDALHHGASAPAVRPGQVVTLLAAIDRAGLQFIKTEHLYTFDHQPGYSMGQGE